MKRLRPASAWVDRARAWRSVAQESFAESRSRSTCREPHPGPGLVRCLRTSNVQETLDNDDVLYVSVEYVHAPGPMAEAGDIVIVARPTVMNSWQSCLLRSSRPNGPRVRAFIAAIRALGVDIKVRVMHQLRTSAAANSDALRVIARRSTSRT